jgi:hypothetical protein
MGGVDVKEDVDIYNEREFLTLLNGNYNAGWLGLKKMPLAFKEQKLSF